MAIYIDFMTVSILARDLRINCPTSIDKMGVWTVCLNGSMCVSVRECVCICEYM